MEIIRCASPIQYLYQGIPSYRLLLLFLLLLVWLLKVKEDEEEREKCIEEEETCFLLNPTLHQDNNLKACSNKLMTSPQI